MNSVTSDYDEELTELSHTISEIVSKIKHVKNDKLTQNTISNSVRREILRFCLMVNSKAIPPTIKMRFSPTDISLLAEFMLYDPIDGKETTVEEWAERYKKRIYE